MRGKDKRKGTCSNFIPWLRVFEHRGENCFGGCCNPPLRRTRIKLMKWKMKRKFPYNVHFQIACFIKGRNIWYCAKNRFIPLPSYYVYSDIERIDFDFDVVTNVQVIECELPLPLTHTSPDVPIFSYLLSVRLPSQNLQKTLEDIKASERKECQVPVEEILDNPELQKFINAAIKEINSATLQWPSTGQCTQKMVEILFMNNHALCMQDWDSFYKSIRLMQPWMAVYDNIHYTRYVTVYWSTMNNLNEKNRPNSWKMDCFQDLYLNFLSTRAWRSFLSEAFMSSSVFWRFQLGRRTNNK